MAESAPAKLQEFSEILKSKEPLGPYTIFKVGGPAEFFAQPRTIAELSALVKRCHETALSFRILGVGGNVLVRDEGVKGVVARLGATPFVDVKAQGRRIRVGCGASLGSLIAAAARSGLGGLEPLVGMPGTVGGALRHNAGERSTEIGQFVRSVDVMDLHGNIQTRDQDELRFSYRSSNLDDPVLLVAELELEAERPELIVKHLQKAWIERKASHPFSYQAAGRIFKNPPGLSAAALIEQAGLVGAKVGGAHVNERDANFVVVDPGSSARDVVRLIDLVKTRVQEKFKTDLELEMSIW